MDTTLLAHNTVNGITYKAHQSGNVVCISWNGNPETEIPDTTWIFPLTGLPSPALASATNDAIWNNYQAMVLGRYYDARVIRQQNGKANFDIITRGAIKTTDRMAGVFTYVAS